MVLQHFTQLNSPESCPATTTVFHKFGTRPVLTTDYLFIFPSGRGLRASLFLALGLEVLQRLHKLFFWDDAYSVCFFFFFFCLGRDRRSNDWWPEFSQASGHVRNTDMQKYFKQWGQYIIIKIMAFICQVNNASGKCNQLKVHWKKAARVGRSAAISWGKTLQAPTRYNECFLWQVWTMEMMISKG